MTQPMHPDAYSHAAHAEHQKDLRKLSRLSEEIFEREAEISLLVADLRAKFVPWSAIAEELGVTRQSVQQRYGKRTEAVAGQLSIDDAAS